MAGNAEDKHIQKNPASPFSIQLDQTTTEAEEAILIVYVYVRLYVC